MMKKLSLIPRVLDVRTAQFGGSEWDAVLAPGPCLVRLLLLLASAGCTRSHYRVQADRDAYRLLAQQTACTPWLPPPSYGIMPDPRAVRHSGML